MPRLLQVGLRRYAAAAALTGLVALASAGCSGDSTPAANRAHDRGTSHPTGAASGGTSPGSPSPGSPASGSAPPGSPAFRGGPSTAPTVLTAGTDLLDWQPVPGPVDTVVTREGRTSLAVDEAGTTARLTGPHGAQTVRATAQQRISDALLDGNWAVVVLQDRQESRPSVARVVNLADDRRSFTLDGRSDIPTVNGGTWALGEDHLLHATIDRGRYCVATVDLGTARSTLGWCAPPRTGFNSGHITPYGDSVLTFDDSRPSCRTVARVEESEVDPFPGVPDCSAWEGLQTEDGAVWSVIPHERQVEEAHVYARHEDGYADLGPAVSGSLTWCDGAAWFARDPLTDHGPAALLRWSVADGLEVVYETSGGHAFLEAPRCGGSTITITARSEAGDEQVSADLG